MLLISEIPKQQTFIHDRNAFRVNILQHPSVTGPLKALPPLFFKPPKKFCMPLIFEFFPVPPNFQMSPRIILSCPHIILFGGGAKMSEYPQKTAMPLINFDPSSSFFSPDQD